MVLTADPDLDRGPTPRRDAAWVAACSLATTIVVGAVVYGEVFVSTLMIEQAVLAGLIAWPLAPRLPAFAAPIRGALLVVVACACAQVAGLAIRCVLQGELGGFLRWALWEQLWSWGTPAGALQFGILAACGAALGFAAAWSPRPGGSGTTRQEPGTW